MIKVIRKIGLGLSGLALGLGMGLSVKMISSAQASDQIITNALRQECNDYIDTVELGGDSIGVQHQLVRLQCQMNILIERISLLPVDMYLTNQAAADAPRILFGGSDNYNEILSNLYIARDLEQEVMKLFEQAASDSNITTAAEGAEQMLGTTEAQYRAFCPYFKSNVLAGTGLCEDFEARDNTLAMSILGGKNLRQEDQEAAFLIFKDIISGGPKANLENVTVDSDGTIDDPDNALPGFFSSEQRVMVAKPVLMKIFASRYAFGEIDDESPLDGEGESYLALLDKFCQKVNVDVVNGISGGNMTSDDLASAKLLMDVCTNERNSLMGFYIEQAALMQAQAMLQGGGEIDFSSVIN